MEKKELLSQLKYFQDLLYNLRCDLSDVRDNIISIVDLDDRILFIKDEMYRLIDDIKKSSD